MIKFKKLSSNVRPICIKQDVVWNPLFQVVQQLETSEKGGNFFFELTSTISIPDKLASREIHIHNVPKSQSAGSESEKDEHNVINFLTSAELKMVSEIY